MSQSTTDLVSHSVQDLSRSQQQQQQQNEESPTFKTMSMKERCIYIKELITVEPLLASYFMATVFCKPALDALELEKACRVNWDYNDTVCDAILYGENQKYQFENTNIQKTIASVHSWQQPLQSIMPLILVLFLGSYSDRHKIRRPFLLLPILGEFFAVGGCILCALFMEEWPLEVLGIAQTVVPSFFGGPTMIIMAVFAYIADVSTLEMRTLRVGVVQIVLSVCHPIVQSFSGILYSQLGYVAILGIGGGFLLFGFLHGFYFIKEPKVPDFSSKQSFFIDVFNPTYALETCNLLLKETPDKSRLKIHLVLFLFFIYNLVVVGEGSVVFLYIQNIFQWTVVEFSYLSTINTIIHLVGNVVGISLLTKILNLHDLTILTVSLFDKVITNIILGLAKTVTWLYVGSFVSVVMGLAPMTIRSMATKTVSEDDLGKAQSLFSICEAISQAIAIPFFNQLVYINTIETLPAAFFFVGIILYIVAIAVVVAWYLYELQHINKTTTNDVHEEKSVPLEDLVTHI